MKVLSELDIWAKGLKSSNPLILKASIYPDKGSEDWYFPSKNSIEQALDEQLP